MWGWGPWEVMRSWRRGPGDGISAFRKRGRPESCACKHTRSQQSTAWKRDPTRTQLRRHLGPGLLGSRTGRKKCLSSRRHPTRSILLQQPKLTQRPPRDKHRRRPRVIKARVGTSILPKGEGATRTPSRCPTAKRQVNICVPLTPSLADWLTLVAPSAVFEGDRIDLTCQKKNDWWKVKRVSYYKDGEELQFSSELSNCSIQRAVLSDSGTYHCAVSPIWPIFPFQKEKTSRSVRIEVQGSLPSCGTGAGREGSRQSRAGPGRGT